MAQLYKLSDYVAREWATTNEWNILVDGFPEFPAGMPAFELTEPLYSVQTQSWELANSQYSIATGTQEKTISFSLYELEGYVFSEFFKEWAKETSMKYLSESYKTVVVQKFNSQGNVYYEKKYSCIPSDRLDFQGTADKQPLQYQFTLIVVGEPGNTDID